MIAGVVSYMLLCWGGGVVYVGLVSLTSSSYPSPLLARKLSKPEDGRYRPKHVVFPLLINTIIEPYIYSCVFY